MSCSIIRTKRRIKSKFSVLYTVIIIILIISMLAKIIINNFTVFYFYHILSTWNAVFYSARLFAFTIIYYLALSSSVSHLIFSVMFAVFTVHFIIFLKSWLLRHLTKMINFLFTYSIDMNLSKFWETLEDRGGWCIIVHRVTKSQTRPSDWTTTNSLYGGLCGSTPSTHFPGRKGSWVVPGRPGYMEWEKQVGRASCHNWWEKEGWALRASGPKCTL